MPRRNRRNDDYYLPHDDIEQLSLFYPSEPVTDDTENELDSEEECDYSE